MGYPLEKILTTSARDYVESRGKRLADYELIGVHFELHMGNVSQFGELGVFPEDAEVVTDLRVAYNPGFNIYVDGTALVPVKNYIK
jgi:hypothetical protein